MSKTAFSALLKGLQSKDLVFTEHFLIRQQTRGIGRKTIEDFLLNRLNDLISVTEDENKFGLKRFRAFYDYSRRKTLLIVADKNKDSLRIVTCMLILKKKQLEMVRNASKFKKFASRLR